MLPGMPGVEFKMIYDKNSATGSPAHGAYFVPILFQEESKRYQHHNTQHDTIPAEYLEVMLLDVA